MAMKQVMALEEMQQTIIATNMQAIRTIVCIAKQSSWNTPMPDEIALINEVETPPCTTVLVGKKSLRS